MQRYCAGLLFSPDRKHVLLIKKNRPAWQAGKFNGLGGKLESNETPLQAMHREFFEEAGISGVQWRELATLSAPFFEVEFFYAFDEAIDQAFTAEDEAVMKVSVECALSLDDSQIIPNLRVLIPLALDRSGIMKPVHMVDRGRPTLISGPVHMAAAVSL